MKKTFLIVTLLCLVAIFAATAGLWAYIVLWIVVPKAVTPAEQCEMRGLTPSAENLAKFERLGADWALVQAFTPEYGATPPEDFLRRLVSDFRVRAIVAGENYTFGAGGRGDAALIQGMAGALGYRAEIVPPVMDGDVMCSSTRIRQLIEAGETEHAARLLRLE